LKIENGKLKIKCVKDNTDQGEEWRRGDPPSSDYGATRGANGRQHENTKTGLHENSKIKCVI